MKRRFLSLVLALTLVCFLMTTSAFAANPVTITENGMSLTFSDVISYEDITVCFPDSENEDGTPYSREIRIYHLPKDAAVMIKNIGKDFSDLDRTEEMDAFFDSGFLDENYILDSGELAPYPVIDDWESRIDDTGALSGTINLREHLSNLPDLQFGLARGESSGNLFLKVPTELGKIIHIGLSISIHHDPIDGVDASGEDYLDFFCAYDNGEFSFANNSIKDSALPGVEYLYGTVDPGENMKLPTDALGKVTDSASAASAVKLLISSMTSEQKSSSTGVDLATLYAETAVSRVACKTVDSGEIAVNAASVADLASTASQAAGAVESALSSGGVTTARYLSKTVTLTTDETDITIQVDPDILTAQIDRIRIETPSYALTLKIAGLKNDLTEPLTFKAQELVSGYALKKSSGRTTIKIDLPKVQMANPIIVSLPRDKGDTTYQAIVKTDGSAVSSKLNPAALTMDGWVNASGTYTVKTNEKSFTDISGKSAEMQKAILYLTSKGIISGTSATEFSPDNPINRQQIAALLMRALGKVDNTATTTFTDVSKSSSLYQAIASSQRHKIINGYSDNTFRGTNVISKSQIVTVSGRVLSSEMNYKTPTNADTYLGKYSDSVPDYAQAMVALATQEGLVVYRTDGTFSGDKNMTRGDAAIILYRLFQKIW